MDETKELLTIQNDYVVLFFWDLFNDEDIEDYSKFCVCNLLDIYTKYYSHVISKNLLKDKIINVFQGKDGLKKIGLFYQINKKEGIEVIKEYAYKKDLELHNQRILNKIINQCGHPNSMYLQDNLLSLVNQLKL